MATLQLFAKHIKVSIDYLLCQSEKRRPSNSKAIDDPEVINFMKNITGQLHLDDSISEKDRAEISEDLAQYFNFKLHQ